MGNTILTRQEITREFLRLLINNLAAVRSINRQYDNQFAKSGGKIGSDLKIRLPNQYAIRTGATMSVQDTTQRSTTLTVANQIGVDVQFSSVELTLSLDDFSKNVLEPAAATLGNEMDRLICALYKDVFMSVGTPGTTPATAATILAAGQKLDEAGVPRTGRAMIVNPAANAALVDGMKGFFNPQGTLSDQFKKGTIGNAVLGFDTIGMDQNIATHTVGALGGTPLVNGASQTGSSLVTDGWTAAAANRLKQGDVFTIAGVYAVNTMSKQSTGALQQFTVTADTASDAAGNATVPISPAIVASGPYQNVSGSPADNAALTVLGTAATQYPQNLAFHKDAFTLVTADLEMPPSGWDSHRETYENISIRYIRGFDIVNDKFPARFDILYGMKALRPEMACRVWG